MTDFTLTFSLDSGGVPSRLVPSRRWLALAGLLTVMSLLASPEGHLTNLSTAAPAALEADGIHAVPLFPSASDELGRQGFARVVNRSAADGTVRIVAYDDTGLAYDAISLALGAGRTAHFNSDDLERRRVSQRRCAAARISRRRLLGSSLQEVARAWTGLYGCGENPVVTGR